MKTNRYQRLHDEESGEMIENAIELTEASTHNNSSTTSDNNNDVQNSLHPTGFSIRILYKEKSYDIHNLTSDMKIYQLKEMITRLLPDLPTHRQRLIMSGKLLKPDEQTLEQLKISNRVTIHVFPLPESTPMPVTSNASSGSNNATNATPLMHSLLNNIDTNTNNTNNTAMGSLYADESVQQTSRELRWWSAILLILSMYTLLNNFSYFSATGRLGSGGLDSIVFLMDTGCSCLGIWVANMAFRSIQTYDVTLINKYVYWLGILTMACILLRVLWVIDIVELVESIVAHGSNTDSSTSGGGTDGDSGNNDTTDNNDNNNNNTGINQNPEKSSTTTTKSKLHANDIVNVAVQACIIAGVIIYAWISCYLRARQLRSTVNQHAATVAANTRRNNNNTLTVPLTPSTPAITTPVATPVPSSNNLPSAPIMTV